MSNTILPFELKVPCSSEFVGVVRLAISGIASRMNFAIEDIEDIKVSISEACTNVIQHAYGDFPDLSKDFIFIKVNINNETLSISIEDNGKGFDVKDIGTEKQISLSKEKLGLGLGIEFIKSLMDFSEI